MKTFFPVVMFTILGACTDRPSPELAEGSLRARIDKGSEDRIKLSTFTKMDGQSSEVGGVSVYRMAFHADLEFIEDVFYVGSGSSLLDDTYGGDASITSELMTGPPPSCATDLYYCVYPAPDIGSRGGTLKLTGTMAFEKSESGWRLTTIAFRGTPSSPPVASQSGSQAPAPAPSSADASICVEPSGTVLSATHDAYVGTVYHQRGAAGDPELSFGGWGDYYYDYIYFDLPSDSPGMVTLCLFATAVPPNDPQLQIGVVAERWDPTTISVSARPAHRPVKPLGPVIAGWNAVDISEIAHGWASGSTTNFGIALIPSANNQTNGAFAAVGAKNASHRPKLVLSH